MLVASAGMIAYANSFGWAFVFDDSRTIEENPRLRHVWPVSHGEWLAERSLGQLTFAVNYATGKLNPADYHATNVLIHILAGLALYLRLVVWPVGHCLDYDWPMVARIRDAWLPLCLIGAIAAGIVWAARSGRGYALLGIAFVAILAPTSSFIPRPDLVFEHRMYLPLAAAIAGIVAAVYGLTSVRAAPAYRVALALDAVVALGFMTHQRNADYQSEECLWLGVLKTRPRHVCAYANLATLAYRDRRFGEAGERCRQGLSLLPDFGSVNRSQLLAGQGVQGWEMPVFYYAGFQNVPGLVAQGQGRIESAETYLREAVRLTPGNVRARHDLGAVLFV